MLTQRQTVLLNAVIKEYAKTAEPVASESLVKRYRLNISPATARIEMLELNRQGFLLQPHLSAGRVPTEAAYYYFLSNTNSNINKERTIAEHDKKRLARALDNPYTEDRRKKVKNFAKALAEISEELIMIAFSDNDFYYTGIANLFSQPEFKNYSSLYNLSQVLDHLDYHLSHLFKNLTPEIQVLIGSKNPIDPELSLVAGKFNDIMLGILGPMRMDYQKNKGLMEYSRELVE